VITHESEYALADQAYAQAEMRLEQLDVELAEMALTDPETLTGHDRTDYDLTAAEIYFRAADIQLALAEYHELMRAHLRAMEWWTNRLVRLMTAPS
jgi:hypothetical protein